MLKRILRPKSVVRLRRVNFDCIRWFFILFNLHVLSSLLNIVLVLLRAISINQLLHIIQINSYLIIDQKTLFNYGPDIWIITNQILFKLNLFNPFKISSNIKLRFFTNNKRLFIKQNFKH